MRIIQATIKPARIASQPPTVSAPPAPSVHQISPALYADLLGKPFLAGGRGPGSYDCVGIALAMAARLGKTFPAYLSTEAALHAVLLGANGEANGSLADCPQIARPVPGCLALFRISPTEHHVAFMVDEYRMIHTMQGINCSIERVNSNLWQRRVIGFYHL